MDWAVGAIVVRLVRAWGRLRIGWSAIVAFSLVTGGCKSAQSGGAETHSTAIEPSWAEGQRYLYKLELSSRMSLNSAPLVDFELDGEYALHARAVPRGVEFAASLPRAEFRAKNPAAVEEFKQVSAELRAPYLFTIREGKLIEVELPPKWSRFARSISRTLAAALQFRRGEATPVGSTWKASEVDATGKYEAQYEVRPSQSGEVRVGKRKLAYDSVDLGKLGLTNFDATLVPTVLSSQGSIALVQAKQGTREAALRLRRIEYEEKLQAKVTKSAPVISVTKLNLTFAGEHQPKQALSWKTVRASTTPMKPNEHSIGAATSPDYDCRSRGDCPSSSRRSSTPTWLADAWRQGASSSSAARAGTRSWWR